QAVHGRGGIVALLETNRELLPTAVAPRSLSRNNLIPGAGPRVARGVRGREEADSVEHEEFDFGSPVGGVVTLVRGELDRPLGHISGIAREPHMGPAFVDGGAETRGTDLPLVPRAQA